MNTQQTSSPDEAAREYLASELEKLKAAKKIVATDDYRELDGSGNPIDRDAEKRRVAALVVELEQRVADARADVDAAESFQESLENGNL